tara:strand:+ start:142 stop:786 length:645 start_codon:yes stop_codon:yes gene_type:complete
MELTIIQKIAVFALPAVLAITVHEAAHGYAAKCFGDLTSEKMGRITLNPIKHIDLIGTVLLPIFLLWSTNGKFVFGWAKPVPVNFSNLRSPKKDMLWVAAAGPASNFAMAILWALILNLSASMPQAMGVFLSYMSEFGITINLILMVLNLLPLPPLDGGRIAVSLLPTDLAIRLSQVERYGIFILMALMFSGYLGRIMWPIIGFFQQLILSIFA